MRGYDRTITLERFGPVKDAYGDEVDAWALLKANVPARRRMAPGSERLINDQNAASAPVVFYVPWAPVYADLSPKDRVLENGQPRNIVSVVEIERRGGFEIATVKRADG
jgi:head-tail adaptor